MKSGFQFAALAILALAVWLSFGGTAFAYDVGDKVEIDYGGTWYPGQVKEINEAQYFVGYDGSGSNWDEWVGSERLRVFVHAQRSVRRARRNSTAFAKASR